jgi:hypothetical protein
MSKVRITVLEVEGAGASDIAPLMQAVGGLMSPGVAIKGEVLELKEASAFAAPLRAVKQQRKPRAVAAVPVKAKRPYTKRAKPEQSVEPAGEPAATEAPAPIGGKGSGPGVAIVKAFAMDNNTKFTDLARDIYGDASGESLRKIRISVSNMVASGRLKKIGPSTYKPAS